MPNSYTNHSLRATAITRMFNGSIPEKVIAEKSGHKSLRAYKKTKRTTPHICFTSWVEEAVLHWSGKPVKHAHHLIINFNLFL